MKKAAYHGGCFDLPAVEAWLEEQARRDWRAVPGRFGRGLRFVPQEPQEARFRLEPNDDYWGGPWPKQKALYEELGWEYAGRLDLCCKTCCPPP